MLNAGLKKKIKKSIINKYISTSQKIAPDVIYKIKKQQWSDKGFYNHFITTSLIVYGGTA